MCVAKEVTAMPHSYQADLIDQVEKLISQYLGIEQKKEVISFNENQEAISKCLKFLIEGSDNRIREKVEKILSLISNNKQEEYQQDIRTIFILEYCESKLIEVLENTDNIDIAREHTLTQTIEDIEEIRNRLLTEVINKISDMVLLLIDRV